jgi:hypothetical protein
MTAQPRENDSNKIEKYGSYYSLFRNSCPTPLRVVQNSEKEIN